MTQNERRLPRQRHIGTRRTREWLLFLRRWLAHPLRVAALLPSPPVLGELIAQRVPDPGERFILEVGAGTGAITRGLLRRVPEEQLVIVELDEELCRWLRQRFPRAIVLCGDATELAHLLPERCRNGNIAAVISGIPIVQFTMAAKRAFVEQCFSLMGDDGGMFQYSYLPLSPLPARALGIEATRIGATMHSPLPMFLWRFVRPAG